MMTLILLVSNRFSFTEFFLSFFCIQTWFPGFQHTMNSPGWFVANLMFFYCIFPFIFFFIKNHAPDPGKLLFGSILLWVFTLIVLHNLLNPELFSGSHAPEITYLESFPLAHFSSFYMGICGAYLLKANGMRNHLVSNFQSIWHTLFLFVLFGLFTIVIYNQTELAAYFKIKVPSGGGMILPAPILLLLIINLSTAKNYLTKIFSLRFFCLLGTISYPLYILQKPIYGIYEYFLVKPLKIPPKIDFVLYLMLFILLASVLTIIENITLKRLYKKI